jgi:hypothetical protein
MLSNNSAAKAKVLNVERAKGVDGVLLAFLQWWQENGSFDILVAPDGGLRIGAQAEANQLRYFSQGNSNAKTLRETPHGRGAALDLWPVGFNPDIPITLSSPMEVNCKAEFYAIGEAAEAFGLTWGGRWSRPYDLPHVQVKNWTALPYPPRA